MEESSELMAFYIIRENDDSGKSAHGPYMMADAESRVGEGEKIITQTKLISLRKRPPQIKEDDKPKYTPSLLPLHEKMSNAVRSWGNFLIIIGILEMITSGSFVNTWGILLILVGLASYYFRSVAMFGIYGTILSWAMVTNLLFGSGIAFLFSVLQAFFAFQTFRQFFRYRTALSPLGSLQDDPLHNEDFVQDKAAKFFPWLGFMLGLVSFVGFFTIFLSVIIYFGFTGSNETPIVFILVEGVLINVAVIGFAAGFSSIFLNYKHKLISIVGMITSALVLLIEIVFGFV